MFRELDGRFDSNATRSVESLERATLLRAAEWVGGELLSQSFELEDGSISWGRGYGLDGTPAVDAGIYNGRWGETLLLAGLYRATGKLEFLRAVRLVTTGYLKSLDKPSYLANLIEHVGLGLTGVGSIIYALVRIAGFTGDLELLEHARNTAASISLDVFRREKNYEILSGSACSLLALVALADAGHRPALVRVLEFAECLLEARVWDPIAAVAAWPTRKSQPSSGFAHGSCGISHALVEVHRRVNSPPIVSAALEGFRYARGLYRDDTGEWPDFRDQPSSSTLAAWCHGATGVGLARLGALSLPGVTDAGALAIDVERVITFLRRGRLPGTDCLCCGDLGRLDFLLEAGRRLDQGELVDIAAKQGLRLASHILQYGYRSPSNNMSAPNGPGLWQGLAGLGYTFLRVADPDVFPSVLLLA